MRKEIIVFANIIQIWGVIFCQVPYCEPPLVFPQLRSSRIKRRLADLYTSCAAPAAGFRCRCRLYIRAREIKYEICGVGVFDLLAVFVKYCGFS